MDDFSSGGEPLGEALRHLRRLNRLFGAGGPIIYGINHLWEKSGRPGSLTVLDVGSGSGDINRQVLKWANRRGVSLTVMLADVTEEAEREAARLFSQEARVSFIRKDLFELADGAADIVTASQFVHHFSKERLPDVVKRMRSVSQLGVVVGDIHRHWIPWTAVWLATRLLSRNRYIRHDGPLSVAKGFRGTDIRELAEQLGTDDLTYRWRPLFRYAVIVPKRREAGRHEDGV
ncbi:MULTISPECIES: methyltransferase domain-containing protein [unclassified Cohnella]|uniref:methyltransferase domain-containing protein n=1 Tax=unclassified Cohnella TaxID=2636738 RepID=UPI001E2C6763|nr:MULTISPECIES: methyltransferase domain-containing protein [unclassified Cohnella]